MYQNFETYPAKSCALIAIQKNGCRFKIWLPKWCVFLYKSVNLCVCVQECGLRVTAACRQMRFYAYTGFTAVGDKPNNNKVWQQWQQKCKQESDDDRQMKKKIRWKRWRYDAKKREEEGQGNGLRVESFSRQRGTLWVSVWPWFSSCKVRVFMFLCSVKVPPLCICVVFDVNGVRSVLTVCVFASLCIVRIWAAYKKWRSSLTTF